MINTKVIHVDDRAFLVKKEIQANWFVKALDHYGSKEMCKKLGCDKILRNKNNVFLFVDEIKDVEVIEYVDEKEKEEKDTDLIKKT